MRRLFGFLIVIAVIVLLVAAYPELKAGFADGFGGT
jgi:hypothetical protein